MPFALLLVATMAQAGPADALVARRYVEAVACASDFVDRASLARDRLDELAVEAVAGCARQRDEAARGLAEALPEGTPKLAKENVEARMRIGAYDRLILRLERGDASGSGQGPDALALNGPAARYAFCLRAAAGRKLAGVYLGEDWFPTTLRLPKAQAAAQLTDLGRAACPNSRAAYAQAFDRALKTADRAVLDIARKRCAPPAIEAMALDTFLKLAP